MTKTQEELEEIKEEYKTLNTKLQELSEDELKTVVGGFGNSMHFFCVELGHWYTTSEYPNHILQVIQAPVPRDNSESYTGAHFAKYWYDGTNAWNHGTCTASSYSTLFYEENAPTSIHIDKMYTEIPF